MHPLVIGEIAKGNLVVVRMPNAYEGCLGAVQQRVHGKHRQAMFMVFIPNLGRIVLRECDLLKVTPEQVKSGEVEVMTPRQSRLHSSIRISKHMLMEAFKRRWSDESKGKYAAEIVRCREELRASGYVGEDRAEGAGVAQDRDHLRAVYEQGP